MAEPEVRVDVDETIGSVDDEELWFDSCDDAEPPVSERKPTPMTIAQVVGMLQELPHQDARIIFSTDGLMDAYLHLEIKDISEAGEADPDNGDHTMVPCYVWMKIIREEV